MALIMAAAAVVAVLGLKRGVQTDTAADREQLEVEATG